LSRHAYLLHSTAPLSTSILLSLFLSSLFFFNAPAPTEIYTFPYTTLFRSSLDRDPGWIGPPPRGLFAGSSTRSHDLASRQRIARSEEHTSELQSLTNLVCRLLLEKKKNIARAPLHDPNRIQPVSPSHVICV